jgi:pimeloyl-ACP methyl ester carboxylesterase
MVESGTGAVLHVERSGADTGPMLVFTHGWAMDSTVWSYARREFGASNGILTWDLAGLGQSRPPDRLSLEQMADDLLAILNRLDRPAVLIGHSIGGMTIQTLARRRPDMFDGRLIAGVVLVNTTYTNPLATMIMPRLALALRPLLEVLFRVEAWLLPLTWIGAWQSYLSGSSYIANRIAHGPHVTRSQLEHVTLVATRNNPAVVARGNVAMFRWDAEGALRQIGVPVLVLSGEGDIVTRPSASDYIAASTPASRLTVVERANHMSILDEAQAYHREIRGFLSDLHIVP